MTQYIERIVSYNEYHKTEYRRKFYIQSRYYIETKNKIYDFHYMDTVLTALGIFKKGTDTYMCNVKEMYISDIQEGFYISLDNNKYERVERIEVR